MVVVICLLGEEEEIPGTCTLHHRQEDFCFLHCFFSPPACLHEKLYHGLLRTSLFPPTAPCTFWGRAMTLCMCLGPALPFPLHLKRKGNTPTENGGTRHHPPYKHERREGEMNIVDGWFVYTHTWRRRRSHTLTPGCSLCPGSS